MESSFDPPKQVHIQAYVKYHELRERGIPVIAPAMVDHAASLAAPNRAPGEDELPAEVWQHVGSFQQQAEGQAH
eukprot:2323160-Alexandrium_andersonii.AAC.1